jgi:mono/diheme cytochrome c family protein
MTNKLLKIGGGLLAVVAVLGVTGATTVNFRWNRTFDVPDENVTASTDSAVIARGAYLAYGPAHCAYCHNTLDKWPRLKAGERVPLSGGYVFDIGIAKVATPNLTPDQETGIGNISDGRLARMLRHNVRSSGVAAVPFMEFQNLSDEDLVALISFLRSQPAVKNPVTTREFNLIGKTVMSFVIKPSGPTGTPLAQSPAEAATVERGQYLVNNVADCAGCHTKRSQTDGSYLAPRLSGGTAMKGEDGKEYTPPNLTPDAQTGHIYKWTEDQFLARFRAGPINGEGSHMPWAAFGKMSDDDIRAIYRYLKTVPATSNVTGPLVADATKK